MWAPVRNLSLRSRVLISVVVVAVLQVAVAFVVVSLIREQFIDQVDDRLEVVGASVGNLDLLDVVVDVDDSPENPDRRRPLGDVYQGRVLADGALETIQAVNAIASEMTEPSVSAADLARSLDGPITVALDDSGVNYRVSSTESLSGDVVVTAIPLDDVERRIGRLNGVVAASAALMILALAAVTWWLVRLGVRPLKAMTTSAEEIAAGDLSTRVTGAVATTEAGQLGHALNTMMGRIESSFEEKTIAEERLRRFMADASHELRTPVATIRGYAELYESGGLDQGDELDDAMRRTRREAERMSRLISDMLRLARLDRDHELVTMSVDVGSIAREIASDATARHTQRDIVVQVPDEPVRIDADDDLLRQALSNLVANALEHTDPPAAVRVIVSTDEARVLVRVADDGRGMTAAERDQATDRFFRADPSRRRPHGGAGLGLSIVDSIVTAHDWRLDIDSTPHVGTTVTISIPIDTGA